MSSRPPIPEAATQIALPWIIRLRYGMVAGQLATIIGVHFLLKINLPLLWIAIGPALVAGSNLLLANHVADPDSPRRIPTSTLVASGFVLDTLCLTGVLMLSGGPTNPFSLLYLVHITLSAAILSKRETWLLGGLSILCFGLLFQIYRPIPVLEMHHRDQGTNLHLIGMWVGFGVATLLVAMFSGKISELLRLREESLLRIQGELAKKDRLASLATLAAGAAHELSTPLGTIAIVAKELERYATSTIRDSALADDSRLIRTEVDRCHQILWRMSVSGAEPAGEAAVEVIVNELLTAVKRNFSFAPGLRVEARGSPAEMVLVLPRHAVEQALFALVKNALEASSEDSPVELRATQHTDSIAFEVRDHGYGMSADALRHAGEPFFTTKEPGKGMGLGIFLVRTLADRLGGRLGIQSKLGEGTTATLELPCSESNERLEAPAVGDRL